MQDLSHFHSANTITIKKITVAPFVNRSCTLNDSLTHRNNHDLRKFTM